jgi:hypothetical protein
MVKRYLTLLAPKYLQVAFVSLSYWPYSEDYTRKAYLGTMSHYFNLLLPGCSDQIPVYGIDTLNEYLSKQKDTKELAMTCGIKRHATLWL